MELREILAAEVDIEVDVGAPTLLDVTYRPAGHTWEIESGVLQPTNVEYLEAMVARWGLTLDGDPVPLEAEALYQLPADIVTDVVAAIIEDMRQGKAQRSPTSRDGSAPAAN